MSNVKAKIRLQFDMSEDRTAEMFNGIKKSLDELGIFVKSNAKITASANTEVLNAVKNNFDELNKKVNEGLGVPGIENEFIKFLTNIQNSYEIIKADLTTIKSSFGKDNAVSVSAPASVIADIETNPIINETSVKTSSKRGRGKQRKYTDEDKKFIADESNSIGTLVEKYGYTKQYAYKMRSYFKNQLNLNDDDPEPEATETFENDGEEKIKPVKNTKYSDEDIRYITDKRNSIDTLVEKYGFADKAAAYRTRGYLKRTYVGKE
jgi:hypothetical protein